MCLAISDFWGTELSDVCKISTQILIRPSTAPGDRWEKSKASMNPQILQAYFLPSRQITMLSGCRFRCMILTSCRAYTPLMIFPISCIFRVYPRFCSCTYWLRVLSKEMFVPMEVLLLQGSILRVFKISKDVDNVWALGHCRFGIAVLIVLLQFFYGYFIPYVL
jgi:hypothetical protein